VALVRKRTIPTERPPLVGVVPTFAGRGCCVVSATNSHGLQSRFSRTEPLHFHSSSSSIVLTRLSRPRSRHPISQKMWRAGNQTRPIYPLEKSRQYLLERRVGGPQRRSGRCGEERKIVHCLESNLGPCSP
jgi:hypothetical protein